MTNIEKLNLNLGYSYARIAIAIGISKPKLRKYQAGILKGKEKELITKKLNNLVKIKFA